ncbi:methylated-DNA--[protein]-cysteine S-methyltransferase [Beijerinckia indica]|nr:methylated-DNA--[protein]-cysteine S-methyltransferase [Beijerinckia indica]
MAWTYLFETPWGLCALQWSDLGVVGVRLPSHEAPIDHDFRRANRHPTAEVVQWGDMLRSYFAGDTVNFRTVPLDQMGVSETKQAIYAALREVEYGQTTSYGALAIRAGHPGAARAVGTAMARNRWPIIVPCHRVLAKNGALGGFSAPGGVNTKRRLLELEGAVADSDKPLPPGLFDKT